MENQTASGVAITPNGEKYVKQLVKHWSHKPGATFDEVTGRLAFSNGNTVTFSPEADRLNVVASTGADEDLAHWTHVIDVHLQRFAFREDFVLNWDSPET